MILSISDVFCSGVGAHVTVEGSVLAVELNTPVNEDMPVKVFVLCDIMLVNPLVAADDVVENLWSSLDDADVASVVGLL